MVRSLFYNAYLRGRGKRATWDEVVVASNHFVGDMRYCRSRDCDRRTVVALPVYSGPLGPEQAEKLLWRAGFGQRPGKAEQLAGFGMRNAVLLLTRPSDLALEGPEPMLEDSQPIEPYEMPANDVLWWLDRMVR